MGHAAFSGITQKSPLLRKRKISDLLFNPAFWGFFFFYIHGDNFLGTATITVWNWFLYNIAFRYSVNFILRTWRRDAAVSLDMGIIVMLQWVDKSGGDENSYRLEFRLQCFTMLYTSKCTALILILFRGRSCGMSTVRRYLLVSASRIHCKKISAWKLKCWYGKLLCLYRILNFTGRMSWVFKITAKKYYKFGA